RDGARQRSAGRGTGLLGRERQGVGRAAAARRRERAARDVDRPRDPAVELPDDQDRSGQVTPEQLSVLVAVHGRVDVDALESMIAGQPRLALAGVIDNDAAWSGRAGYDAHALLIACSDPSDDVLDLIRQETAGRT